MHRRSLAVLVAALHFVATLVTVPLAFWTAVGRLFGRDETPWDRVLDAVSRFLTSTPVFAVAEWSGAGWFGEWAFVAVALANSFVVFAVLWIVLECGRPRLRGDSPSRGRPGPEEPGAALTLLPRRSMRRREPLLDLRAAAAFPLLLLVALQAFVLSGRLLPAACLLAFGVARGLLFRRWRRGWSLAGASLVALSAVGPVDVTRDDVPGPPRLVPLVYGLPSEEGFAMAERGEILLGGCIVRFNSPRWVVVW